MRVPRLLVVWAAMAAAWFSAAAQNPSAAAQAPPIVTTARGAHDLPPAQAAHTYPVHLRVIVTYYDPYFDTRHAVLFVCDRSGCVFVDVPARPILPLSAGDEVEITGVTGPGEYTSVIVASQVRRVVQSSLPAHPPLVTPSQILTGNLDAQWVELEGRVRSVRFTGQNFALQIASGDGTFSAVSVRQLGADYEPLVDSLVRVRGIAAPTFNARGQMVGPRIFFPTLGEVHVIQPAPRDPFAAPVVPSSQLFRFAAVPELLRRVHVRGQVTLDWPGRFLCIQDGKNGMCMQTTQADSANLGALVDVLGFPAINELKPTLEDASFRVAGRSPAPAPRVIAPGDALQSDLDGQVVQIDGELIAKNFAANDPALILRAGRLLLPATLPENVVRAASLWKEGSILRVTGVGSVQVDPLSPEMGGAVRPESLHILLRTADDVTVLRTPSWWTPAHTLESFAGVGLVVLASFSWIVVLRRRVEQQTQALRRAVEELAQERDLLKTLMDTVPDNIYCKDRQSRFVRANLAQAKLMGLNDPREAIGKADCDVFPLEDAAAYLHDEQQVIETCRPLIGRVERVRAPDGQYRWFATSKAPICDTQGRVAGLVGISYDITDRLQAEETLRASEERYRELFENASDIVYTVDLDFRMTSLNRAGQQFLGYTEQEARQLDLRDLVVPRHREIVMHGRQRLLAGEASLTAELDATTKDGRTVTLEVKPRLMYKGGKPAGVVAIARDITGRDQAEMELRQAQKLESVGRLAAGIAHEINTPIQFVGDNTRFLQESWESMKALLGKYQQLLAQAESGPIAADLLAQVRAAEKETDYSYLLEEIPNALMQTLDGVQRVATIVRAMKEFAHPETKEMAAADLNQALAGTLTVARNELKYVAEVETEFGALPLVVCNVGDLNQVFLNLLVNAAHAIGEKTNGSGERGKIRVRTAAEGDAVLITISDTGCGIPEAIRTRIFDPFFTTKEVGRGTGQGLAIARSVVADRHKGKLTFESEVGKGTTFYIRLPVDPGLVSKESPAL